VCKREFKATAWLLWFMKGRPGGAVRKSGIATVGRSNDPAAERRQTLATGASPWKLFPFDIQLRRSERFLRRILRPCRG
jgi:hypothetical protein